MFIPKPLSVRAKLIRLAVNETVMLLTPPLYPYYR